MLLSFLSENECLDGMEPVHIYFIFFSETQAPRQAIQVTAASATTELVDWLLPK